MRAEPIDIDAVLAAWRRSGADRRDPLRYHRIVALQRRAAARDGGVRQALEARLAALVGACADAAPADGAPRPGHPAPAPRHGRGALGALVDDMATGTLSGAGPETPPVHVVPGASYPELPALQEFRQLWSQLRTGSQVRQALAQLPDDSGPLNSSRLVHRSLTVMRGLSPAYLQHFLAYADTLSWLDEFQAAGVLGGKAPTPPGSGKPRARGRAKART